MNYTFFYIMILLPIPALIAVSRFKQVRLPAVTAGLVSIGYSLIFDITFGGLLGLYYYINLDETTVFMILAAVFIYAPLDILFLVFIPSGIGKAAAYTAAWTAGMLLLECACLSTGTLVFTGWRIFPWSFITYAATYIWIIKFYRYLDKRLKTSAIY